MTAAHKAYSNDYRFHVSVAAYDGGACLAKHLVKHKDDDSCSYRWQGVEKASNAPGRAAYDAHRNAKHHIGGRGAGCFDPNLAGSITGSAGMAGVVLGKRTTKKGLRDLIEVTNFTTGFVPYGNQVHHVLNASSLRKGIDDLTNTWEPIRWVIVNGLLGEKYNLNHKDNNIILPTRAYHCRETGLPTHCGGHPAYSKNILTAVESALKPYKKIANQMKKKKNHDPLEPEKLKKALTAISDTMYNNLLSFAAANRIARKAVSINDLPAAFYKGL